MGDDEGVDMTGWFEARVDGPGREHFRLFCLLENDSPDALAAIGLPRPAIAVIAGGRKPFRSKFPKGFYEDVQAFGADYKSTCPRRIALPDPDDLVVESVSCDSSTVTVQMKSGLVHSRPIFGGLIKGSDADRNYWTRSSDGSVIYWPRLNESLAAGDLVDD